MTDDPPARPPRTGDELADILGDARVDPSVLELRPDYRVLLLAVDGLLPAPSDARSEELIRRAETGARELLASTPPDQVPHVASWREAYRGFGAKPQRTRNSLEALLRRVDTGLPRVNRLTDIYNAVSVAHLVPLGGEDLDRYVGPPRLIRATGAESFITTADGEQVVEQPEPGEVVWCDDEGVTCRRWNWRQATRTRLSDDTTAALYIFDALDPHIDHTERHAADELLEHLAPTRPALASARRLISLPNSD